MMPLAFSKWRSSNVTSCSRNFMTSYKVSMTLVGSLYNQTLQNDWQDEYFVFYIILFVIIHLKRALSLTEHTVDKVGIPETIRLLKMRRQCKITAKYVNFLNISTVLQYNLTRLDKVDKVGYQTLSAHTNNQRKWSRTSSLFSKLSIIAVFLV